MQGGRKGKRRRRGDFRLQSQIPQWGGGVVDWVGDMPKNEGHELLGEDRGREG